MYYLISSFPPRLKADETRSTLSLYDTQFHALFMAIVRGEGNTFLLGILGSAVQRFVRTRESITRYIGKINFWQQFFAGNE